MRVAYDARVSTNQPLADPAPLEPAEPSVVLRRLDKSQAFEELGLVVEAVSAGWIYRTADGAVGTALKRQGCLRAVRGSINHILLAYPQQLAEAFVSHPSDVIEQIISEAPAPISASDVKQLLAKAHISQSDIDKAWASARRMLLKSDDFVQEGMKYRRSFHRPLRREVLAWVSVPGYDVEPCDPVVPGSSGGGAMSESPVSDRGSVQRHDDLVGTGPIHGLSMPPLPTAADTVETEATGSGGPASVDAVAPAADGPPIHPLLRALRASGVELSVGDLTTRLLDVSAKLAGRAIVLPDQPELSYNDRFLGFALVMATPGDRRAANVVVPFDNARGLRVLRHALSEISGAEDARRERLAPAMHALVDRLLLAKALRDAPLDLLVRAVAVVGPLPRFAPYSEVFGELVSVVGDRIERAQGRDPLRQLLDSDQLEAFASAVATLPLAALPRIDVLRGLHLRAPTEITNARWWAGLTISGLLAGSRGLLRDVLADPQVIRSTVRPRVLEALLSVADRAELFSLAAAPAAIVDVIDGDAFEHALMRVGQKDVTASRWVRHLARTTALDSMRQARDDAVGRTQAAEARVEELMGSIADLESERQRLLERARSARDAAAKGQEARARQARLSARRTLAEMAAAVAVSPGGMDRLLEQRIMALLDREGLSAVGAVGHEVAFDPGLHDAQGQIVGPGETVTVVRPAYTVHDGDHTLVLAKAHVSTG